MPLNERDRLLADVKEAIGPRGLIYCGIRGGDAVSLARIDQLAGVIALTDAFDGREDVPAFTAETISRRRIDLDGEVDLEPEVDNALRRTLGAAVADGALVMTYRANPDVADAIIMSGTRAEHVGPAPGIQAAFEYKPWVDHELSRHGVRTLGWRLIAPGDNEAAARLLDGGDVMLRPAAGSGGYGVHRMSSLDALRDAMSATAPRPLAVSRYRANGRAINIGAVAWRDTVTVHPMSVQLIGLPYLVTRPFAYCGNDFAAAARLGREVAHDVDAMTLAIGDWLRAHGYIGAFGVDFLLVDDEVVFCELNPRFQGSSRLSDRVMDAAGQPTLTIEHLAACLGLEPPRPRRLHDVMREIEPLAQAVFHRLAEDCARVRMAPDAVDGEFVLGADVVCPDDIVPDVGAVLFRAILAGPVTDNGFELVAELGARVCALRSS